MWTEGVESDMLFAALLVMGALKSVLYNAAVHSGMGCVVTHKRNGVKLRRAMLWWVYIWVHRSSCRWCSNGYRSPHGLGFMTSFPTLNGGVRFIAQLSPFVLWAFGYGAGRVSGSTPLPIVPVVV